MKKLAWIFLFLFSACSIIAFGIFISIPSAHQLKGCFVTKMYQVNLCPGSKNYAPLKTISPYLQKAVLLAEDSTFYQHNGFNWDSIEKSAEENWRSGKIKRGGSTISQQLSKNLFFSKDKTFLRKIFEALYTIQIEKILTKNEIFERYLNVVEFGKDIYGIKSASQFYFKKSPQDLNVPESVFLAILLPSPVKYSNSFFKKDFSPFVKNRIQHVMKDLYQYQRITEQEYNSGLVDFANFFGPVLTVDEQSKAENQTDVLPDDEIMPSTDSDESEDADTLKPFEQ